MSTETPNAIDAAGQAADDFIEEQLGPEPAPEQAPSEAGDIPPAPTPEPDGGRQGDPEAYNRQLRQENAKYRETWSPFEQAFGSYSDDERLQILQTLPRLGGDLTYLSQAWSGLHPDDRAYLTDVATLMQSDPAKAAEMLREASEQLQKAAPPAGTVPSDLVDTDTPLTAEQVQRLMDERLQEVEYQRQVDHYTRVLHDEAKTLGYDPDADKDENPDEHARFSLLVDMAQALDGDLSKAHERIESMFQARIDSFVESKRDDSRRTSAPTAGGSPSTQRAITTLAEADAAVESYIESIHGPDPRRR